MTVAVMAQAQTVNSVVIWPIDPAIESHERATPLWLENPGKRAILLQIRVFGWDQEAGEDRFSEQKEVTGTPPMVRIEPAQRQLVRLTRTVPAPAGREQAYRVVIDEIPLMDATPPENGAGAAAAIQFRMRYSLPLFVYGEGTGRSPAKKSVTSARPALQWRTVQADGKWWLEIRNGGTGHARLNHVALAGQREAPSPLASVNGYVLPGATMRWALPRPAALQAALIAAVNGGEAAPLPRWNP